MKFEIKKLFRFPSGTYMPVNLGIREQLWWRFVPGVVINVRWPTGETRIKQESSGVWDYVKSADPNDHYRPWMEEHVGQQGWDWNWGMADRDATDNRLTIKFRRKHRECAIIAKMMWA